MNLYLKAYQLLDTEQRKQWLGILAMSVITALLELVAAKYIVGFAQMLNDGHVNIILTLMMGTAFMVKNAFAALESRWQNNALADMSFSLKNRLLNSYVYADNHEKFIRADSSQFVQIVNNDVDFVFFSGYTPIAFMLSEALILGLFYGLVFYYSIAAGIAVGVLGLVAFALLYGLITPLMRKYGSTLAEAKKAAVSDLSQIFDALTSIVIFGLGDRFIAEYNAASSRSCMLQAKLTTIRSMPRVILETLFMGCFVIALVALSYFQLLTPKLCGMFVGLVYIGLRMASAAGRIISGISSFNAVGANIERLHAELF